MKLTSWKVLVVVSSLAVGCGAPAPTTGTIKGTVSKAAGGALSGVAVTTVPATVSATTDAAGAYTLDDLAAGTYKVVFTLAGYTTKERANISVVAGQTLTLDTTMDPATGTAKLTVKDICGAATGNVVGAKVARTGATDVTTDSTGAVTLADLSPGTYTLTVSADGYLPATTQATVTAGGSLDLMVDLTCQHQALRTIAKEYVTNLTGVRAVAFTAKSLNDNLNDGDSSNNPMVISTRSSFHYVDAGHVPGSYDMPYTEVATDANLAILAGASDAGVKAFCYTGHTGGIATGVLNMLGVKTSNMKFGFVAWTQDAVARTSSGTPPGYPSPDYTSSTTAVTAPATNTPPRLTFAATTASEVAKLAARAYLADLKSGVSKAVITASALDTNLKDGNATNDPFILDVRAKADYDTSHIPGSVNIPIAELANAGSLEKLPTDKDIVVVCYTGHTGAVATAVLGVMGYKKVTNLKYGYAAWVAPATRFMEGTDSNNFVVNYGPTP